MLPREWLPAAAAVGSVDQCAARILDYRLAGADEILIHGMTPERLEPIVQAFERISS
jgi:5,10-methylenetetrahydromethanopterin reductase